MALVHVSLVPAPARAPVCLLEQEKAQQKGYCQARDVFWGRLKTLCPIVHNPESQPWSNTCIGKNLLSLAFTHFLPWHFVYVCRAGKRQFNASLAIFQLGRIGSTFHLREKHLFLAFH